MSSKLDQLLKQGILIYDEVNRGRLTQKEQLELPSGVPLVPPELLLNLLVDALLLPNLV